MTNPDSPILNMSPMYQEGEDGHPVEELAYVTGEGPEPPTATEPAAQVAEHTPPEQRTAVERAQLHVRLARLQATDPSQTP